MADDDSAGRKCVRIVNLPAFAIVMFVTWLLLRGARESARANSLMVVVKLLALALFVGVGVMNIDPANYSPFAPNGFAGIHQGAAIVFFAYIGFDAVSTAAEETRDPRRTCRLAFLVVLRSAPSSMCLSEPYYWHGAV